MKNLNLSIGYFVRHEDKLSEFERIANQNIQLGLNSFSELKLREIKRALDDCGVDIRSIHLPKIKPEDAQEIEKYAEIFGTYLYTLHPDKRTYQSAELLWGHELKILERKGIKIGFENLKKTGSWIRNPLDLPIGSPFKLTFDFEHLNSMVDEIDAFKQLKDNILITHIVSRKGTMPYDNWDNFVPYMFANPQIDYVLEYGRDNLREMKSDSKLIMLLYRDYLQK